MSGLPEDKAAVKISSSELAAEIYDEVMIVRFRVQELTENNPRLAMLLKPTVAGLGILIALGAQSIPDVESRHKEIAEQINARSAALVAQYGVTDPEELKQAEAIYARQQMGVHAN